MSQKTVGPFKSRNHSRPLDHCLPPNPGYTSPFFKLGLMPDPLRLKVVPIRRLPIIFLQEGPLSNCLKRFFPKRVGVTLHRFPAFLTSHAFSPLRLVWQSFSLLLPSFFPFPQRLVDLVFSSHVTVCRFFTSSFNSSMNGTKAP